MINKHFLFSFLCLSCLSIALSGCSKDDDEEEPISGPKPVYADCSKEDIDAKGDTVEIRWYCYEKDLNDQYNKVSVGLLYNLQIQSFKWEYLRDIHPLYGYEMVDKWGCSRPKDEEVTAIGDTIVGDWFTITPIGYEDRIFCNGIKVVIAPNTTGERRLLDIRGDYSVFMGAFLFQECEEQTPKLPVFRYFDGAEFDSLFVSSTWTVNGIYDVDKDGNLGKNILTTIDGLGSLTIDPAENGAVHFRHQPTDPNQTETVTDAAYTFQTANWLTFDKTVAPCPRTLKVLEITDKQMRCLGDVYDKAQSPNAIKGLYVFKRQVKE